ncbi:type II toxin-antitoxin system HipA family toxin [Parendozoicomonas sp. Alg238-R29]|uniref:type II toxin-antitoxin system HipA family toxin n=1 Tax=Parendozoicomonas sp. Alg238-R29 TaxID=2993446 RepID=UPI00248DB6D0|nr:type II toxin-antitoxin system HipA family toxin [Parendozoicomonas sp. Alg238-R29]
MADVDVYLSGTPTGRLAKVGEKHVFTYDVPQTSDVNNREAVSLTMPLRLESYSHEALHPVFQMNLPEGHLREVIERATAKQYGSDDLTMLAILGRNHIGRLEYSRSGQPLPPKSDQVPDLFSLLGSNDEQLFSQLMDRFALQSAVAGVQPKVLVDLAANPTDKVTFPLDSYIIKSWGDEFPELACNEYVCLTLCREAGLNTAPFYLSDNGRLLITERFDIDDNKVPMGFEDFCVLQGKTTREKYDASLESCTNVIRHFVSPEYQPRALSDFFKLTLINILVRNGDAHLKNSGVIYSDLKGHTVGQLPAVKRFLAPVFDVVSTVPYLPNDTMALSLTGSKRWPKWKVLEKFGKSHCGLNNREIKTIVADIEQAVHKTLPLLAKLKNSHPSFAGIADQMEKLMHTSFDS